YNANKEFIVQNIPGVEVGPAFTQSAVDTLINGFGSAFVAIALFFFAFTTLMAYYYIAEVNLAYLSKRVFKSNEKTKRVLINVLKVVILMSTYYGCIKEASLAWTLGDIGVGVMAWLNIVAILIIAKPALVSLKDYEEQKRLGIPREEIHFNPIKLGIKNASFWEEKINKK
ncbi:MAG: alanine:cation symporter family protein, partial [Paraclostridium sp.]